MIFLSGVYHNGTASIFIIGTRVLFLYPRPTLQIGMLDGCDSASKNLSSLII